MCRLLVVEDHEMTRNLLRSRFIRMGWQVFVAATVAEAIALLDSEPPPCCLILDIELPDGTGDQVLRKLRLLGLKTRVIVSSGTSDPAKLEAMAKLKPDEFLPKPMTSVTGWVGFEHTCPCTAQESSHLSLG